MIGLCRLLVGRSWLTGCISARVISCHLFTLQAAGAASLVSSFLFIEIVVAFLDALAFSGSSPRCYILVSPSSAAAQCKSIHLRFDQSCEVIFTPDIDRIVEIIIWSCRRQAFCSVRLQGPAACA